MLDTFQLSKTLDFQPKQSDMEAIGGKAAYFNRLGYPSTYRINGMKGEPRITISRDRNNMWYLRAEVSLGSWLNGSNLHLPNEIGVFDGLKQLSRNVTRRCGIEFDALEARVSRVDFTQDFQVKENSVIETIEKFSKLKIMKYNRCFLNDSTLYFQNGGKYFYKKIMIYSKHHERIANSNDKSEHFISQGLLRLEVSIRKAGINSLIKSFKLPKNKAKYILTRETSEGVIEQAKKQLHFSSLVKPDNSTVEKLLELYGLKSSLPLIGFLYLKDKYGDDTNKWDFNNASPKTIGRYIDACCKAGILSLE